jgi:predicted nucleotidyltransferase
MSGEQSEIAPFRHVLARHFSAPPCRVFLFGSRASGEALPGSDWDIGVWSDEPVPCHVFAAAREDLDELPSLHTYEIVDFAHVEPEFRRCGLRHAIPILGDLPDARQGNGPIAKE